MALLPARSASVCRVIEAPAAPTAALPLWANGPLCGRSKELDLCDEQIARIKVLTEKYHEVFRESLKKGVSEERREDDTGYEERPYGFARTS
jgi:hypothetical protein